MTVATQPSNLELVVLPPAFGLRNVSPFCLKMEMLMTSLGLDFESSELGNPGKAPKGKLPYLVADGQKIADSELIAEYLDNITDGAVFGHYSSEQLAHGWALSRLVEDHLYWIVVASRWLDDDWFPNVLRDFFGIFPGPVGPIVGRLARRQVRQTYHLHGLGRHTMDEQRGFARRDLEALSAAVPDEGFLYGDQPGYFDFTLGGFLPSIYEQKPPTWVNSLADDFPNLKAYADRVQDAVGVWAAR